MLKNNRSGDGFAQVIVLQSWIGFLFVHFIIHCFVLRSVPITPHSSLSWGRPRHWRTKRLFLICFCYWGQAGTVGFGWVGTLPLFKISADRPRVGGAGTETLLNVG